MKPIRERRPAPTRALLALLTLLAIAAGARVPPRAAGGGGHGVARRVPSLPACAQVGQQVTLTLNTGTAGALPPPGTADPIWTVLPATTAFTTAPVNPPSLWLPNSANPKWIQPAPGGNPASFPVHTYVYSTQFLTPVDPYLYTSISLSGSFAADDTAIVKLNGVPIATCPGGNTPATWCFHSWKPIPPAGLSAFNRLGSFLNTLTVEVQNTQAGSSSGLIVRAQVTAVCSKCTSPVPPPNPPCGGNPSTC